jgi:hypothetical protein
VTAAEAAKFASAETNARHLTIPERRRLSRLFDEVSRTIVLTNMVTDLVVRDFVGNHDLKPALSLRIFPGFYFNRIDETAIVASPHSLPPDDVRLLLSVTPPLDSLYHACPSPLDRSLWEPAAGRWLICAKLARIWPC